jgi:hypothetical protein
MRSAGPPDPDAIRALAARYGLEMKLESIPDLIQRFGLRIAGR